MTTYNLTANTTSSNDSDTQNVLNADTVVVAVTAAYGLTVQSTSNCSASVSGASGSNPTTATCTVTFGASGAYSVVFSQAYQSRTYTLTGTVTGQPYVTVSSQASLTEPAGNSSALSFNFTGTIYNINYNSTVVANSRFFYKVYRQSGSVGSWELGYTNGFANISGNRIGTTNNYTWSHNVVVNDDLRDETGWGGETFYIEFFSDSNLGTRFNVNQEFNTATRHYFTLYDGDFLTLSASPTSQTVTGTSANITLNRNTTDSDIQATQTALFYTYGTTSTYVQQSFAWPSSNAASHTFTLNSSMVPAAGQTWNYSVKMSNGLQWVYQPNLNFSMTKAAAASLVAPTSNGAIATESSTSSPISVTLGFSSYGSGGIFQVMQSTVHSNPPPSGTWITVPSSPYIFSQSRGSTMYYYSRRYDSSTGNTAVGTPTPVGEQVPTTPVLSSVTDTATSHTVVLLNNPSSDGITTVYYYQSQSSNAMASDTAWRDQGTDSPPSGWQTSPTFTGISTTTTYYYWAMGWTNSNPGPDGAVLSGPISKNSSGGSSSLAYGMEIRDAGNNLRMSTAKRQPRLVGYVSGTGNGSTFNQSWTNFNTPSPAEWLVVSLEGNSNYYATQGTTAGSFQATRADVRTSNASYQVLSGSEDYKFAILRY